jgi:hypothetical protein
MIDQKVLDYGSHSRALLSSLGLIAPQKPVEDLHYPSDLSVLSDDELAKHLAYWSSMCGYAHQKVSVLEGALVLAKVEYDQEYDLRLYHRQGSTISERKLGVSVSKVLREMKVRVASMEADLKVLKAVLIGYDLKNSAISREITRRHNERNLRDG